MGRSSKPTGQPPPDSFIDIHVINEHHTALAATIRVFLLSQVYGGRIPRINAPGLIPAPAKGKKHKSAVAIISFDEFTDIPGTLLQLDRAYDIRTVFIAHLEFENQTIETRLEKSRIQHIVTGFNYSDLIVLIQSIAEKLPKSSKPPPAA